MNELSNLSGQNLFIALLIGLPVGAILIFGRGIVGIIQQTFSGFRGSTGAIPSNQNSPPLRYENQAPVNQTLTNRQGLNNIQNSNVGFWGDSNEAEWGVGAGSATQTIKLSTLATSDNILVVGQKGAGKTTLLRKIVAFRKRNNEALMALDPHASPGKWPCETTGGGRDYEAIGTMLTRIASGMDNRFKQLASGEVLEGDFPRRSVISDEYRSIADELNGKKETVDAGKLLLSRISEGRKVGECALVACHNDTTEALGIQGNADMKTCFDYIVYMGALVDGNRTYKAPVDIKQAALKLARPAIAWHPERNNWYVLEDDISMEQIAVQSNNDLVIEIPEKQKAPASKEQTILEKVTEFLVDNPGASQRSAELAVFGYAGGSASVKVSAVWAEAQQLANRSTTIH